jgi:hypothetical protein
VTYGLRLDNQGGKRVIGADTSVPRFVGKFSRSTWSSSGQTGYRLVFSMTCPQMPLCFVYQVPGRISKVLRVNGSGTNWTVVVLCHYVAGMSPSDYTLYAFSAGYTTQSASGYGMRIKKASGEVAFDTGYKMLQIRKSYYGHGSDVSTSINWAASGVSKPAFMGNLYGDGFLSYMLISRYTWAFFFGWFPTNVAIHQYRLSAGVKTTSAGFDVNAWLANAPAVTLQNSDWVITDPGGGVAPYATLNATKHQDWINKAEYVWGSGGQYSLVDGCVGCPACPVSAFANGIFNVPGITYANVPASGTYDLFWIDGADYD